MKKETIFLLSTLLLFMLAVGSIYVLGKHAMITIMIGLSACVSWICYWYVTATETEENEQPCQSTKKSMKQVTRPAPNAENVAALTTYRKIGCVKNAPNVAASSATKNPMYSDLINTTVGYVLSAKAGSTTKKKLSHLRYWR